MITQESWARLTTTWLSLYREGAIQIKTLLNQVPGLNVEEELAAKEQADAEAFEKAKEIAAGQGNQDNEDEQGGDQGNQGKGGGGLNPFAKKDKGAK
jgi:hypothetical protein